MLLLEDDPDVREDLAFLIESRGYPVVTAADGREAIATVRAMRDRPGLILLDLMMPVMDGWTFHAALRDEPALRDIPVVVLSGIADLQLQANTLGAVDFLGKPIDLKRLWGILARVCGPLRADG